ncbi:DUF6891 domain-containing protein [Streptacidiphilus cavernicola]|uniref:DUF6891 domain-containing protein n=1 Tax=Streptacidiphilus cavernicola TaxID=3342716 RepID=A0ABV6VX66_9ACTN
MLAITVQTENGRRLPRPTATDLAELIRRIGDPGDAFLIVERIPDLPDVYIQVLHQPGDGYTLEYRDGAPERHYQTRLDGPEPVITAMTAWARLNDDWDAGIAWELLDLGRAPALAAPVELDDEEREQLESRVREVLHGGYATRADLAELAEEYLVSGNCRPVAPAQAEQLVNRLWQERVEEQARWDSETDPERLTRAFAALEAAGITARENFTCCLNCGQTEIGAGAAAGARGYVYFHEQCTDGAVSGSGLTLLYGGFDGSTGTTTLIGREVAAAIEAAGLPVQWDGDPERAITVTPLDWRRRLPC